MIFLFLAYFLALFTIFWLMKLKKTRYTTFPKLNLTSKGLSFFSHSRHRIKIDNAKVMQVGDVVYLKQNNQLVTLNHVDNIYQKAEYLYFDAKGECEICFSCVRLAKYFNIKLKSPLFDIRPLKDKALLSITNNLFTLTKAVELKNYLKAIKDMLKINITKKQVKVSQNQFKIPYTLEYVANNTRKIIYVNNRADKN